MSKEKKIETKGPDQIVILYCVLLAILFIALIASFLSLSNSINSINSKIDSLNQSLELESDDHYINVQKDVQKSVVVVLSAPARKGGASNNNVIFLDNNGQEWNLGTGFSFDDQGNILTANHVVEGSNVVLISLPNDNSRIIPIKKWTGIPDLDLAILYVNSSIPPVKLQGGDIEDTVSQVGSSVAFIGFPMNTIVNGKRIPVETSVKGSVSSIVPFTYKDQKVPVYILGGTANYGNSGGPVFSLKTGKVIGIINEKILGTEGITISTAINQNLINNLKSL